MVQRHYGSVSQVAYTTHWTHFENSRIYQGHRVYPFTTRRKQTSNGAWFAHRAIPCAKQTRFGKLFPIARRTIASRWYQHVWQQICSHKTHLVCDGIILESKPFFFQTNANKMVTSEQIFLYFFICSQSNKDLDCQLVGAAKKANHARVLYFTLIITRVKHNGKCPLMMPHPRRKKYSASTFWPNTINLADHKIGKVKPLRAAKAKPWLLFSNLDSKFWHHPIQKPCFTRLPSKIAIAQVYY